MMISREVNQSWFWPRSSIICMRADRQRQHDEAEPVEAQLSLPLPPGMNSISPSVGEQAERQVDVEHAAPVVVSVS